MTNRVVSHVLNCVGLNTNFPTGGITVTTVLYLVFVQQHRGTQAIGTNVLLQTIKFILLHHGKEIGNFVIFISI